MIKIGKIPNNFMAASLGTLLVKVDDTEIVSDVPEI